MPQIVLLTDPEVVRIPVIECGEQLVDLHGTAAIRVDARLAVVNRRHCFVRVGVADRLVTAQTLLPSGLRLLVVEALRSVALQEQHFRAHVDKLRARHTERDEPWLQRQASMYVAPVDVAPHVAGAAVDLTLCALDGTELPMGTEINDTETDACHTYSPTIKGEHRLNRSLLASALSAAGLVNYPTEWWHWSYGDRYWAYATQAAYARYGPVA